LLDGAIGGRYAGAGQLLFGRGTSTVYAVAFDADRVEAHGDPKPVFDDVDGNPAQGRISFAASPNGTLAFLPRSQWSPKRALVWVDRSGKQARISVSGSALDIAAPGEDMTSTNREGGYNVGENGTSDAAAIVSGAAALLRSKYPKMSAKEVVERLESTAVDKGAPGVDPDYGHGIIDIVAALSADTAAPTSAAPATTTTAAAPAPAPQAEPETEPAGSNTPLIAGGVVGFVLLGGLLAFLLARRRSRPTS